MRLYGYAPPEKAPDPHQRVLAKALETLLNFLFYDWRASQAYPATYRAVLPRVLPELQEPLLSRYSSQHILST
jgi:hypothetical protein